MAEFGKNEIQNVIFGNPITMNTIIGCNKGYVYHRNGSGIITLRGIVNNPNACFARYFLIFKGNIAVPDGETVAPISVGIAIDGEPLISSTSISTPAAVEQYNVATCIANINVPRGCCYNISVENITESQIPINVQKCVLNINRTA